MPEINIDAIRADIASARAGTCDDDAAWRCVDHAGRLAAEMERLREVPTEMIAVIAERIANVNASMSLRMRRGEHDIALKIGVRLKALQDAREDLVRVLSAAAGGGERKS